MVGFIVPKVWMTSLRMVGRAFAIVPYSQAKEGFVDLDEDDHQDRKQALAVFQDAAIKLRGDNWS